MFRQARQNRVFEDVVDQIQEAVLEGRLKAGSKLPSERELQEIFKASRGTLREALRVLEQKGLIAIKTGVKGGAVVKTPTTSQVSDSLDLLIRYQRVSLRDLAEFREGVEGIVAGLAVERAKTKDIQHLKKLLQEAEEHLAAGETHWDEMIKVDNQLHLALAHMAGNPIYEYILETIYDNIHRYFDRFLVREEDVLRKNYQDLCEIVKAVEKGEAAKAHLLVQSHVYKFNRLMEEKAREEGAGKRIDRS
jgi:GntR family transcriptional repressor for pyruvate dehydrogenase complex